MSEAFSSDAQARALERIEVLVGDITRLSVDAVVNAANEALLGGGGVDGAIHAAAGSGLVQACRALPEVAPGVRCPTGEARITPGFQLPARFVIHTVGPVWRGGQRGEPERLASCYRRSIELAHAHQLATVAFPAISTGIYGYPLEAACRVAVGTLVVALQTAPVIARVSLVAFGESTAQALRAALEAPEAAWSERGRPDSEAAGPGATAAPLDVVTAWLEACNAAQVERVVALSAPDVELVGPRGSHRGSDVLRSWLARAGVRFETRRVVSEGEQVIVEQHGAWHTAEGPGEADVATRFLVRQGRVQRVERHDTLAAALAAAGIPEPGAPG